MNDYASGIVLNGTRFTFIKRRTYDPVSILACADSFLRIGPPSCILPERKLHLELLELGFPVARIIAQGELGEDAYYIEESLGSETLGGQLKREWDETKGSPGERFAALIAIAERFTRAQLKAHKSQNADSFRRGIGVHLASQEKPELAQQLEELYAKVLARTAPLPWVITHGDYNPYNLTERGVIDFASSFVAPAGYDTISLIYHTYNFPPASGYEAKRHFSWSKQQAQTYLSTMDELYREHQLPPVSAFQDDFVLCRAIWSAVRMQHQPRVQTYRYNKLSTMLAAYLQGKPVLPLFID